MYSVYTVHDRLCTRVVCYYSALSTILSICAQSALRQHALFACCSLDWGTSLWAATSSTYSTQCLRWQIWSYPRAGRRTHELPTVSSSLRKAPTMGVVEWYSDFPTPPMLLVIYFIFLFLFIFFVGAYIASPRISVWAVCCVSASALKIFTGLNPP